VTVPHSLHACWTAAAFATRAGYAAYPTAIATASQQSWVVKYRRLGDSDLHVSEIGLGSWLTFGGGIGRADAEACVNAAFEEGINFIDTANVYAHGAAEELLGEVLQRRPRDSYVLATKLYFPMSPTDRGLSRAQVHKQLDASLARLKVDHVDLYQCHRYDAETPLAETMEALSEVVQAGKARTIGFSEWSADEIRSSLALSPPNVKFVSSQPQYSLLWREPEREIFPLCAANGISQVVWSPLAQGVLTGKYRPGARPAADTRMASDEMGWAMGRLTSAEVLRRVERLGGVAAAAGMSTAELALAWVLREPNVSSAIIGASRAEQVRMNARAAGLRLDAETLAEVEGILH
jgi:1-deoxyxylulose-5-phosphate synthase